MILFAVVASGFARAGAFVVATVILVVYGLVLALQPMPGRQLLSRTGATSARHHRSGAPRPAGVGRRAAPSILLNPLDETIFAFVIAFLQDDRGMSVGTAGLTVVAADIGGIGALLLAPRLVGRSDDHLLVATGVALAASVAAFAVLPDRFAFVPLVVVGAGVAVAWTVLQHRELTLRPGQAGTDSAR